jgi:hypothetical protein
MDYDDEDLEQQPTPTEALRALAKHREPLRLFYGIYESGTERARALIRQPGFHYDHSFLCHAVRYFVSNKALSKEDQQKSSYRFIQLPNTGIEIQSRGDRIRFWKANGDGEIPPPGDSQGRQDFCKQPIAPLFDPDQYSLYDSGRLIVLWDLDGSLNLSRFELACPREWESAWKSPKSHWKIAIPHPAMWLEALDFGASPEEKAQINLEFANRDSDELK